MAEATQAPLSPLQQLTGPAGRQLVGLLLASAAAVALAVGAWTWAQSPDYRVLFSNVNDRDGGAIIAALGQMNIPFRFADGGGAILVPGSQVHEARLRLASQGLPKGSLVGFELMESSRLGSSQFLEQVNFQRALEGELARSIQALAAVSAARVHLAIPKPSVFLRDQHKPSASVLVNLNAGRSLEPGQVSAIVHLVSSSVPDLLVKNVTVVDQSGTLLSGLENNERTGLDPSQLRYIKDVEQGFARRIQSILLPMVGPDNVHAQVTADLDFSVTEQAEELYRPNQGGTPATVRSQNSSESANGGAGPGAGGVPGALSNQPPGPASAPITGAAAASAPGPAGAGPSASRRDSSVQYEVDKTLKHVRNSTGNIKRLSVAVVVNHKKVTTKDGKVSYKPMGEEEMGQINKLVREAIGFSESRGDSVTVANTAFNIADAPALQAVPLWKDPGTLALAQDIGKHLLIGVLVLFLFLKVLRPMFRTALTPPPPPAVTASRADGQPALPNPANTAFTPAQPEFDINLAQAKQFAQKEPKMVANIVRSWVADER
ncbi:MAG: flagellar basal-body MS-ring/collar protein FliF [Burkholderiales bacterium]